MKTNSPIRQKREVTGLVSDAELPSDFRARTVGFIKGILGTILQDSPILSQFFGFSLDTLSKVTPTHVTDVQGSEMYLLKGDPISLMILITRVYEPVETEMVKRVVKSGDVALDIGAHIGYYTLILSRLVGEKGHVYAFEPCEKNYVVLKKNVEVNKCRNVTLVNKAVSDTTGKAIMVGWSVRQRESLAESTNKEENLVEVESIRLDDFFAHNACDVDFIKIDVEGHEFHALKGGSDLLRRSRNLSIVSEFGPVAMRGDGGDPNCFLDFLIENDFRLCYFDIKKNGLLQIDDVSAIVHKYDGIGKGMTLLCSKTPQDRGIGEERDLSWVFARLSKTR